MFAVALVGTGPAQAAPSHTTFVEAATRAGTFQTFLGLVDRAQAADRLNAEAATVFMPTDAAFMHLASAQRDAIAALSPDDAKRFVSHFVVPGIALKSNNIDQDITAEDGTSYNVTWFKGRLSLRDHRGPATGHLAFVINGDKPCRPRHDRRCRRRPCAGFPRSADVAQCAQCARGGERTVAYGHGCSAISAQRLPCPQRDHACPYTGDRCSPGSCCFDERLNCRAGRR